MNRFVIEKDWRVRGFSCGLWTDPPQSAGEVCPNGALGRVSPRRLADPPGQVWEDYVHDTDELFMVIEGEVELEMQNKKLRPKTGEEIFIPAHVVHSVRNIGGSISRWLYGYKER